ncbi:superoxide dismutase family protein [Balneola vulgaris]|jgi:Cu-Zn family superoxide dismutase|uniref:superoxide dismutase family protein n=1 Tax=Balneola vulgaris TaxID=287535 RepID=UPI000360F4E6|nr:superoxide dismutase family protein [Balneola vulgaris]
MKNLLLIALCITMFSCTQKEEVMYVKEFDGPEITKAIATVHPVGESGVSGTVTFEKGTEGVTVSASISGLEAGKHGFHIHQYGDCSAADGTSAGGHYNPEDAPHNDPDANKRHVGDMGNLESDGENATTSLTYTDNRIHLMEIVGRGIIIHAGEDDFESQPSGDAGARIACGVIGITE